MQRALRFGDAFSATNGAGGGLTNKCMEGENSGFLPLGPEEKDRYVRSGGLLQERRGEHR